MLLQNLKGRRDRAVDNVSHRPQQTESGGHGSTAASSDLLHNRGETRPEAAHGIPGPRFPMVHQPRGGSTPGPQPPCSLLQEHTADIAEQLQRWAERLEQREIRLQIQITLQENEARTFRLRQQHGIQDLQDLEQRASDLQSQIAAQARRLALMTGAS